MAKELTKNEIEELKEEKKRVTLPKIEEKSLPLVKNTYTLGGKKVVQYKINIPKKFADYIKLDKEKFKAIAKLDKERNKIIIEVINDK
jgi:hypothetical protein